MIANSGEMSVMKASARENCFQLPSPQFDVTFLASFLGRLLEVVGELCGMLSGVFRICC